MKNQFPLKCWPWFSPPASQNMLSLLPQSELQIFGKSCSITTLLLVSKPGSTLTLLSTLTHLTWFPEHSLAESFQAQFSRATLNMWHQNATQEAKCGLTIQSDSKKKKNAPNICLDLSYTPINALENTLACFSSFQTTMTKIRPDYYPNYHLFLCCHVYGHCSVRRTSF